MRTLFIALRGFSYMACFALLWGWVALGVRGFDVGFGVVLPAWAGTLGTSFMALGGLLAVLCVGTFAVRGRGTPALFDAPREFVAVGPYRYVRNPMYIGGGTVLVGFGLYLHSISILILCLAWFLLFHLVVVLYEEPTLKDKFGAAYQEYCQAVRRWIPGRSRRGALIATLVFALAAVAPAAGADPKPDFSGEWKVNLAKSDFGPLPAPLSRTDRIDHKDPSLKVTSTQTNRQGESSRSLSCTTDGTECVHTFRGAPFKVATSARWEGNNLVLDSKGTFNETEVRIREKWTLAPDGKTMTVIRHLASQEGEVEQTIVMERQ